MVDHAAAVLRAIADVRLGPALAVALLALVDGPRMAAGVAVG